MELSEHQSDFDELGVQVAVITYEAPEISLKFAEKYDIQYPVLSDVESRHIKAWGLLNTAYEPESRIYGIPHPGLFLIDRNGMIYRKFSEEGYKNRPVLDLVIDAAREMARQFEESEELEEDKM